MILRIHSEEQCHILTMEEQWITLLRFVDAKMVNGYPTMTLKTVRVV